MSLWELLNDQKEEKKEDKEATEKVEKEVAKESKMAEKPKAAKKTTAKKTDKKKEEKSKSGYTYPFGLYTEGRMVDVSSYGFEDGKVYDDAEITKIMLSHRHYEFAGDIEYNFIKDDNVLVANLKQHKKG